MSTTACALTLKKTLPVRDIELKVFKKAKKALISDKINYTKALQRETSTALRFHRFSWQLPGDDGPWGEVRRKIKQAWSPVGNIKKFSARELVAVAAADAQKHAESGRVWHDIGLRLAYVEPLLGVEQLVSVGISFCRAQKSIPMHLPDALIQRLHDFHKVPEHTCAQALYVLASANVRDEEVYHYLSSLLLNADLMEVSLACHAFHCAHFIPRPEFLAYAEKRVGRALKRKSSRPPSKALFTLAKLDEEVVDPKHLARICVSFATARHSAPSLWWHSCAATMKPSTTETLAAFALASGQCGEQPKAIAHEVWNRIATCRSIPLLVKLSRALCAAEWRHRIIHKRLQQRAYRLLVHPRASLDNEHVDAALDFLFLPMAVDGVLATAVLNVTFQCRWTVARRVKASVLLSMGFRPSTQIEIDDAYTTEISAWSLSDAMNYTRAWARIDASKAEALLSAAGQNVEGLMTVHGNLTHAERNIYGVFTLMEEQPGKCEDIEEALSQLDLRTLSATEIVHLTRLVTQLPFTSTISGVLWRRCSDKLLMMACPSAVDRLSAAVWNCAGEWKRSDCRVALLPTQCYVESLYASLPRLPLHVPTDAHVAQEQKPLWRRLCFDAGRLTAAY